MKRWNIPLPDIPLLQSEPILTLESVATEAYATPGKAQMEWLNKNLADEHWRKYRKQIDSM